MSMRATLYEILISTYPFNRWRSEGYYKDPELVEKVADYYNDHKYHVPYGLKTLVACKNNAHLFRWRSEWLTGNYTSLIEEYDPYILDRKIRHLARKVNKELDNEELQKLEAMQDELLKRSE